MTNPPKIRPKASKVRPVDLKPGDLVKTRTGHATVVSSELVEPQPRKGTRKRQNHHEWWVSYIWTDDQGRPNRQSQRYPRKAMAQACIELVNLDGDPT